MNGAPIAYSYEADWHCPDCALSRFGAALDDGSALDGEGNEPGALAPWDEWQQFDGEDEVLACGTCGRVIERYEVTR